VCSKTGNIVTVVVYGIINTLTGTFRTAKLPPVGLASEVNK